MRADKKQVIYDNNVQMKKLCPKIYGKAQICPKESDAKCSLVSRNGVYLVSMDGYNNDFSSFFANESQQFNTRFVKIELQIKNAC